MQPLIPLAFSVKTSPYRRDDPGAALADADFDGRRARIIARDGWRCRACGCPSQPAQGSPSGGLEVHHLDGDHRNNAPANLVTLCPLCHGILHIGWAARHRPGRFVWLPEMGQAQLNMVVHMAAIARHRARALEAEAGPLPPPGAWPGAADELPPALRLARSLACLHAAIASLAVPDTLLADGQGDGLGSALAGRPWLLGSLLGRLRGEGGVDDADIARVLGGLRYCYDLDADSAAPVYSRCLAWAPAAAGDWPAAWMREGLRCRALLRKAGQAGGAAAADMTGVHGRRKA